MTIFVYYSCNFCSLFSTSLEGTFIGPIIARSSYSVYNFVIIFTESTKAFNLKNKLSSELRIMITLIFNSIHIAWGMYT